MKKWWLIVLLLLLVVSSSMTAKQQSLQPLLQTWLVNEPFKAQLSWLHIPYWDTVVSIDERGYFLFVEFLIRKACHFIIFACIAAAVMQFKLRAYMVLFIVIIIATLDEVRQGFNPGRTMSFHDIWLDTAGGLFAISVILFLRKRRERKV